jgi:hypothetical protein
MFPKQTFAAGGARTRARKLVAGVERAGLGVVFALVIGLLPLSAIDLFSRTV